MNDTKYTVTISGPGFSVMAERGIGEGGLSCHENLASTVSEALGMVCAEQVPRAPVMLATLVSHLCDPDGACDGSKTDKQEVAFWRAADDVILAWDEYDRKLMGAIKGVPDG